jgi:hypothetical protein
MVSDIWVAGKGMALSASKESCQLLIAASVPTAFLSKWDNYCFTTKENGK